MLKQTLVIASLLAMPIVGCATAQMPAPATVAETGKGKTLVDAKGMTLYTFDKDAGGKSACNGPCAKNWPPLTAAGTSGPTDWTVVTRDDGSSSGPIRASRSTPGRKTASQVTQPAMVSTTSGTSPTPDRTCS